MPAKAVDLPPNIGEKFIFAETILGSFTTLDMLYYSVFVARGNAKAILARFGNEHTGEDTAAILFTSGSTNNPKGVPLTNRNVIENLKAVVVRGQFTEKDVLMGALPCFHSFGFTATLVMPMLYGLRCVYTPNPTAYFDIARQMARWAPSIYLSTPTWLQRVYQSADKHPDWVRSMRAVIVGAEKCPQSLKDSAKAQYDTTVGKDTA